MIHLGDVMGASGLSGYAIVALLLFIFAFVLVVYAIFAPSRKKEDERAAMLPFDDGTPPASDLRGNPR